jgi:hypothetical protein
MTDINLKNTLSEQFAHSFRVKIFAAALMCLVVSLSCNSPIAFLGGRGAGQDPIAGLAAQGILNAAEISASEEQVVIEYEILIEEDPELMVQSWLAAFQAAGEAYPEAEMITLRTIYLDQPYLELNALNADVQALIKDQISSGTFLDGIAVLDQRPPEKKLFDALVRLGLQVSRVDSVGEMVVIELIQEPVETQAELFEIWWQVGAAVLEQSLPADRIQIRSQMPDASSLVVEIETTDLEAYLAEEITPITFLARVTIQDDAQVIEEQ